MKFLLENLSKKTGIYMIVNVHTNRIYVGQTTGNFKKRWSLHKSELIKNKHSNNFLQNDYNKCGWELGHDDFLEFYILEEMPNATKKELDVLEEFYIKAIWDKQEFCYNLKQNAELVNRSCFSFTPEETRRRQSVAHSGEKHWAYGKPRSEEHCKNISLAVSGMKHRRSKILDIKLKSQLERFLVLFFVCRFSQGIMG